MTTQSNLKIFSFVNFIFLSLLLSACGTRDYGPSVKEEKKSDGSVVNDTREGDDQKVEIARPFSGQPESGSDDSRLSSVVAEDDGVGYVMGAFPESWQVALKDENSNSWLNFGTAVVSGGLAGVIVRYFYGIPRKQKTRHRSKRVDDHFKSEKSEPSVVKDIKHAEDVQHGHQPAHQILNRIGSGVAVTKAVTVATLKAGVVGAGVGLICYEALKGIGVVPGAFGSSYEAASAAAVAAGGAGLSTASVVGRAVRTRWNETWLQTMTTKIPGSRKFHQATSNSRAVRLSRTWGIPLLGSLLVGGALFVSVQEILDDFGELENSELEGFIPVVEIPPEDQVIVP